MVIKEKIIKYMRQDAYRPMSEGELVKAFDIVKDRGSFIKLLKEMEAEGLIYQTRAACYGLPERMNLVVGRLQGHARGFAFLIPDNPEASDVYISASGLNGAMHGDRVVVRVEHSRREKPEGEVVKILTRAQVQLVGTLQRHRGYGFVVCDERRIAHDIFIPRGKLKGAATGDKVVVEITTWPDKKRGPTGKVVEVLGPANDPIVEQRVLFRRFGLPETFPKRVQNAASRIPQEITQKELEKRADLREWTIVTIDGEDAKDLDDAVSLTVAGDHYLLGVHIADVGYYVPDGTVLDREAQQRATSVYLPGTVIPMLPEALSNGICSLNPQVDRLAMTVVMDINRNGKVVGSELFPSIIKTAGRLTYTGVRRVLEGERDLGDPYDKLKPELELMQELAMLLRQRRFQKGAIDFNLPEAKVVLDDEGQVQDLVQLERSVAEQIIEEFMLITNETVARFLYTTKNSFLYRVHEKPDEEKIAALQKLLQSLGYSIPGFPRVKPGALQETLQRVAGKKEERLINEVTLRSMQQARYSTERLGHFGLASRDYTHFTSPIRRYPDLVNHRILREVLAPKARKKSSKMDDQGNSLEQIAQHSSERERVAVEAEREAVDRYKAAYMQNRIGDTFTGFISGVTGFGMFVELENTVEGLISLTTMTDDYYDHDQEGFRLVGQRTRKIYRLGDEVKVKAIRVNVEEKQIDFVLAEMTDAE